MTGGGRGVPLRTVAREWTRIGITGFGGPPAHIALLREMIVERFGWMEPTEFEDGNAACGLLPGPASTQMAMFCAYRVAGPAGAIVGGLGFIMPAVVLIVVLSALFLARHPPGWVLGAGAGAGAAVAAVALRAAADLGRPSWAGARTGPGRLARWSLYVGLGALGAALVGSYLVIVLLGCGALELWWSRRARGGGMVPLALLVSGTVSVGGLGALAWTAFKVGALSFGGGFVIVPLMQGDAVHTYHWLTNAQFLNAVALGQATPGPVVATVVAVGYGAHGLIGSGLAAAVAFTPSFSFVLLGGARFERVRGNANARAFLAGAGPGAIGAIAGASVPLAVALSHGWQYAVLAVSVVALLGLRRSVVSVLLTAALAGVAIELWG